MSQNLSSEAEAGDDHDVKLDKLVMVRISAEQMKRWQAAADAASRKLPDFIRIVVEEHLGKPGKPRKSR